jgi:pimeloyl-ACP methyl ester carboxylesterase
MGAAAGRLLPVEISAALDARAADVGIRLTAALTHIQLPILVLRGRHDRVISQSATRWILSAQPGAQLSEVDGPHLLLQTRPTECAALVLHFIRRCQ